MSSTTAVLPVASTTTAATATSGSETTESPAAGLPGFATVEVILGGSPLRLALADTPDRRSQGLSGLTDLGGLDGMLFVLDEPSTTSFWMKDTLIPLDVAFFATDGSLIGVATMEPCTDDPCPTYRVDQPWQWAIEVPAGGFRDLDAGDELDVSRDPFAALIEE